MPTDSSNDHCNKTVDIYVDVASPELTKLNRNRPLTCWYRFRSFRGAPKDWVLRLKFKKFKVGTLINATHCDGGYLQVTLHNSIKISMLQHRVPWNLILISNYETFLHLPPYYKYLISL